MSLATRLADLVTRVATEFKNTKTKISGNNSADLTGLNTTAKGNLVAAINEVLAAASSAGAINDAAASATTTYSSNEIIARLTALKNEILGGAASAYDTLLEIQTALQSDDSDISGLLAAVGNRVRFDAVQSLTAPQALQARANIGAQEAAAIGDPEQNLVTAFEAALV
jgi:capsid protein